MEGLFVNWFMIFVRAGAMLSIFPLFSATATPVRLRIALAGFMSFLILPILPVHVDVSNATLFGFVGLIISEISIGLLFGWLVRILMFSVTLAGHFISTQIGLQLGGMVAPGDEQPTEIPAVMLQMPGRRHSLRGHDVVDELGGETPHAEEGLLTRSARLQS